MTGFTSGLPGPVSTTSLFVAYQTRPEWLQTRREYTTRYFLFQNHDAMLQELFLVLLAFLFSKGSK